MRLATPVTKGTVPKELVPSKKLTLPVAVGGEIVAVKVTGWHTDDGFCELVRARPVGIGFTTWLTVLEHTIGLLTKELPDTR
jgi:hypothetical protein